MASALLPTHEDEGGGGCYDSVILTFCCKLKCQFLFGGFVKCSNCYLYHNRNKGDPEGVLETSRFTLKVCRYQ